MSARAQKLLSLSHGNNTSYTFWSISPTQTTSINQTQNPDGAGIQTARTGVKKHLCPVEIPEKQASAAWNLNKNSGLRAAVWREREVTCEIV